MSTGVVIRFSQSDYSAPEEDEEIIVTVQTEGRRATPVTVKVIPLNYDDYLALDIPLPEDLPDVPEFEEKRPNRAKSKQQKTFAHLSLFELTCGLLIDIGAQVQTSLHKFRRLHSLHLTQPKP